MRFKGNNKKASKEEGKEKKDENSYESSSEEEDEEEEQDCKALTRLMNRVGKSKTCSSCNIEIPLNALRCYSCHVDQPPDLLNVVEPITVTKSVKNYKIYQITIQDEDAEIPPFHRYIFKLKERGLIQSLAAYVPGIVMKPSKRKFSKKYTSTVRALDIIIALPKLRAALPLLPVLVQNFVNDEIEPMRKQMVAEIDSCLKYKKITMDALWYIFEPGTAIYGTEENGLKLGSLVKQSSYNAGFMGCSFAITGSIIKTDGEKFFYTDHIFNIDGFEGMKPIDSLSVRVLDRYSFEELSKRGEKYSELALGHHFVQFRGMMIRSVGTFTVKTRMKSRVMVDTKTFNRYHLSVNKYRHLGVSSQNNLNVSTTLSKDEYWMTYPCLPGFSFSMKLWGEYAISDLSTIQFDTSAFTHLVLPEKKKVLIHALVEDYRKGVALSQKIEQIQSEKKKQRYKKSKKKRMEEEKAGINDDSIVEPARHDEHGNNRLFTDIITGKGGGCIFLLHGSPGVGKTLTAEAVCEYLHIPLYMITVGELGTTPNTLEKKLQDILELSAAWGCGILLDEADIFLEKRSKKDILRNAMVGIFLRLLEYHNGVLFLTTNRLSCLDEAFSSRISVALHYDDLDEDARFKIWTTFLAATNNRPDVIAAIDVKQLAAFELNGRQIRSCVRLSTARARNDKTVLSMNHLLTTIRLSLDFKTQFSNEKTVKRSRKQSRFQQTIQVKIPELADPNVTLTGEL